MLNEGLEKLMAEYGYDEDEYQSSENYSECGIEEIALPSTLKEI